jgi:hypothetical protein
VNSLLHHSDSSACRRRHRMQKNMYQWHLILVASGNRRASSEKSA